MGKPTRLFIDPYTNRNEGRCSLLKLIAVAMLHDRSGCS